MVFDGFKKNIDMKRLYESSNTFRISIQMLSLIEMGNSHSEEERVMFAGAILNNIFSDEPTNEKGNMFRKNNKEAIDNETRRVLSNNKFSNIASMAVETEIIYHALGSNSIDSIPCQKLLDNARRLNIPISNIDDLKKKTKNRAHFQYLYDYSNQLSQEMVNLLKQGR